MRKAVWGLLLLSCALLLVSVFTYTRDGGPTPDDPIYIAGDGGFTKENGVVSGSGTSGDPYLVEGWKINMAGAEYGIQIENTTRYFMIHDCMLALDTFGILFSGVTAAKVTENTIELNDWNGIYVDATSTLNKSFHNNFAENKIAHAWDQGLNSWNSASGGNYWDDYRGEERDGDGIGDTPHRILGRGSAENYDYYPLMEPWEEE